MIHINHVSKSFGAHKVLDDVSIHVKPGTIYGIIGENGAGKSTRRACFIRWGPFRRPYWQCVLHCD